ncbi:hypothetical protein DJ533_06525 [Acinetobacter defluvii]|uniref:Uncharacterized protein n=1 Tax=Acinetobacter defluvii TaxID=1871111 RepID=A0A2S2FBA6_9GAMM|nr:hypothetical protein [Acinetobacter defluvii]AWL28253.1 hypothetical protein DJ533_06525 [Acinetobacter defluvii]
MGAVLIGVNEYIDNIPEQFISVDELLKILADCEKTTIIKSAQWLMNHIQILNRTRKLILKNSYTLVEYEYNDNDFYNCPITTIRLIADEEEVFYTDCVGFARYRVLKDLKNIGLGINDDLIGNSPYMSKSCSESDDNFYKNQCYDLMKDLNKVRNMNIQKPQKLSDIHQHATFLNKDNHLYCREMALLGRLNHEFNVLGNYGGRSNKEDKIKDFLRDNGEEYGFRDPKPFNYKAISSLIDLIKDQKTTVEILSDLEVETKEKVTEKYKK